MKKIDRDIDFYYSIVVATKKTISILNYDPKFVWNRYKKVKRNWNAEATHTTYIIEDLIYYKFLKIKREIKQKIRRIEYFK